MNIRPGAFLGALTVTILAACLTAEPGTAGATGVPDPIEAVDQDPAGLPPYEAPAGTATALFAGGCFWCTESDFEKLDGVVEAISGYTGGPEANPTYKQVGYGKTSHLEAVEVRYDPGKVSYRELVDAFWRTVDPTDDGGQFVDRGHHYTTAVFVQDDEQRRAATESRAQLAAEGRYGAPIVTPIRTASAFWPAEGYHQDYHRTNPGHYQRYRSGSGRDRFIERVWGGKAKAGAEATSAHRDLPDVRGVPGLRLERWPKPSEAEIRGKLNDLQHRVTQDDGTEPPFRNAYWDDKEPGLYVDIVSGEPLFSSVHKFDSGTGWPSFTQPIHPEGIVEKRDAKLGMVRVEVRSAGADSHLGHVFDDGPAPTGLRYCINSASLRFVPVAELQAEGYGDYRPHFAAGD